MTEIEKQTANFDFSGNHLSLDFTNTLDDRATGKPVERLNSYSDLVSWSREAQLVTTDEEEQRLPEEAICHPTEAAQVLQRAITLREAIYRIFVAIAEDTLPAETDLATLNVMLSEAMAHVRIVPQLNGFAWDWADKEEALGWMLWPLVRATAELLTSLELGAVRVCASDDCNWLFMDTSKNGSRRWCNMKSCGNRAKARKHYERTRQK